MRSQQVYGIECPWEEMSEFEKKERVAYLWFKVRIISHTNSLIRFIREK